MSGSNALYKAFLNSYSAGNKARSASIAAQAKALSSKLSTKDAANLQAFLKASKDHKDLVALYNPSHDMTQEERTRATARVVGLDVPLEVDFTKPLKP